MVAHPLCPLPPPGAMPDLATHQLIMGAYMHANEHERVIDMWRGLAGTVDVNYLGWAAEYMPEPEGGNQLDEQKQAAGHSEGEAVEAAGGQEVVGGGEEVVVNCLDLVLDSYYFRALAAVCSLHRMAVDVVGR